MDTSKHRYPFSIVWTPIHPLTWLAPYIGHCGVCDAEGCVRDFSGPFHVGQDDMLFGWPTRCLVLEKPKQSASSSYDPTVNDICYRFQRQRYDFVSWNCHSLVAAVLNAIEHPRDVAPARFASGWSIFAVAWLFFFHARHIGWHGWLQSWGGHLFLWLLVLTEAARAQSLQCVTGFVVLQLGTLGFFAGWFGLLTLLGLDSHKECTNALLRFYYWKPVLYLTVSGTELWYMSLFVLKHTNGLIVPGLGVSLVPALYYLCLPIWAFKQVVNVVQFAVACLVLVEHDEKRRATTAGPAPASATSERRTPQSRPSKSPSRTRPSPASSEPRASRSRTAAAASGSPATRWRWGGWSGPTTAVATNTRCARRASRSPRRA